MGGRKERVKCQDSGEWEEGMLVWENGGGDSKYFQSCQ